MRGYRSFTSQPGFSRQALDNSPRISRRVTVVRGSGTVLGGVQKGGYNLCSDVRSAYRSYTSETKLLHVG